MIAIDDFLKGPMIARVWASPNFLANVEFTSSHIFKRYFKEATSNSLRMSKSF